MTQAHPLHWPTGRPRTSRRERSRFATSFAAARDGLLDELRLMGARLAVLSTNVELRRDGLPYANQPEPADPGVAIYFEWKGRPMAFSCDRWDRVKDNVRAIGLTIAALRGLERWGTGDMMESAFTGFEALPAPDAPKSWRAVLGNCTSIAEAKKARNHLAKEHHADTGASGAMMADVNAAFDQAKQELPT